MFGGFFVCFLVPGKKHLFLNRKVLQLPIRAVGLSGIAHVSKGKFRPFCVTCAFASSEYKISCGNGNIKWWN